MKLNLSNAQQQDAIKFSIIQLFKNQNILSVDYAVNGIVDYVNSLISILIANNGVRNWKKVNFLVLDLSCVNAEELFRNKIGGKI